MKDSIIILCAGGPAPGMNTVVATVAKRFLEDGYRVIGMNHGYKTLFSANPDFIEIDYKLADRIFNKGGSYLVMNRYKPKDHEFKTDFFEKNRVKLLVTIGGDDTASTANRIAKFLKDKNLNIQNIHVPKTIDNDLPLPNNLPTFGFNTARNEAARIAGTTYEDARTSGNWFVISSMGREAGHLAFSIAKDLHLSIAIIPEMFAKTEITFDKIIKILVASIVKKKLMGFDYGAAVISEGVFHFMEESQITGSGINFSFDEHGHPELGKVSKAHIFNELLAKKLKELEIDVKSRPVEIGYEVRCIDPTAFDLGYCTALGNGVRKLFKDGKTGCIVISDHEGQVKPLYLKDIEDSQGKIKPRLVDINSDDFKETLNSFATIKEEDYQEAQKYLKNPEEYNLKNILNL